MKYEIQVIQSFLKHLPNDYIIQQIISQTAENNQDSLSKKNNFKALAPLQVSQAQCYEVIQKQFKELGAEINNNIKYEIYQLLKTISPKYTRGQCFQNIKEIEQIVFKHGQTEIQQSDFKMEKGIVYLFLFWASQGKKSLTLIQDIQKMIQKNNQWANKAQIVGISVDKDKNLLIEKIKQNNLEQINHYRLSKDWDHANELMECFGFDRVPFIVLINKQGIIDFLGVSEDINLEIKINELLSVENDIKYQDQSQIDQPQELLTKENFKELKLQIQNIQNALKQFQFEGSIEIKIEKLINWKNNGIKDVQKRSKLKLNYEILEKEKDKLNQFLEIAWKKVPEDLKIIEKSVIINTEEQIKEIKAQVQSIFSTFGVNIQYKQFEKININYDSKFRKIDVSKNQRFLLTADNIKLEQYQQGSEKLQDYLFQQQSKLNQEVSEAIEIINSDLRSSIQLGVGKQFQSIENYKKWGDEQFSTINHVEGQVLLIDYWAKWCGPCVWEIKKNTILLQQNAQRWGKQVKFLSICIQKIDEAIEFMENNKQITQYIDFYFPEQENQVDNGLYNLISIPHYVVVDKFGTIRQIGKVENVERLVDKLINQQQPYEQIIYDIKNQDIEEVQNFIRSPEILNKITEIDSENIIELNIEFLKLITGDEITYKQPKLDYFCRDTQMEVINSILQNIFQLIPQKYWQIDFSISKTISVPYPGNICVVCQKDITKEYKQYYSPFKQEHVCVECAEFDDKSKQGSQRFKYFDTLIFINGPLKDQSVLKDIDDHKIGKNFKFEEGIKGDLIDDITCSGCGQTSVFEGPRYISANTKRGKFQIDGYIEYCQKCFLILKDKYSEQAQAIIKQDEQMTEDNLFVRILFYNGYRYF